jgi:hypothetical protein
MPPNTRTTILASLFLVLVGSACASSGDGTDITTTGEAERSVSAAAATKVENEAADPTVRIFHGKEVVPEKGVRNRSLARKSGDRPEAYAIAPSYLMAGE